MTSVTFLVYLIDEQGVRPTMDKVDAIQKVTNCARELLYHVFLRNKANISERLHRLLDKKTLWKLT